MSAESHRMFVVSDSTGFVGAFSSIERARELVIEKYPIIPFITTKYPIAPGPRDRVWVVLYRGIDAVAFASNDRGEAERVKNELGRVGLTYEDAIDYWEQPFDAISPPAAERLEVQKRAHEMYAAETAAAADRISILDCTVMVNAAADAAGVPDDASALDTAE